MCAGAGPNHAYRTGYRGKRSSPRLRATALAAALVLAGAPAWAQAAPPNLPSGGQISAGSGHITQSGRQLTVTQDSARLAADWQSFSVAPGWSVRFDQPSASAVALNRVLGPDPSTIAGNLTSNGQVFLLNPNGVLFTPTAQVSVGGLVASTLNLSNADFLAGRFRFDGESTRSVVNQGSLRADGTLAFIAARIENAGTLRARDVALATGSTVTLDLGGPVKLQIERGALDAQIANGGAILAGSTVLLSARAAGDLSSSVINHSGLIEAGRLAPDGQGRIVLAAEQGAIVLGADSVTDVSAQGAGNGGTILVGGGFRGGEAGVPNARTVTVEPGAQLRANAGASGNGGTVVIWSDGTTRFAGRIGARGGAAGGDGGLAEVSGARVLDFEGAADLGAAHGRTGTLLLDPSDITISTGTDDTSAGSPFTGNADASILNVTKLQAALSGANVVVDASGGAAAGGGSITVADPVSSASGNSLTLTASASIGVNAAVNLSGALNLNAGGNVTLGAPVTASAVSLKAGGNITDSAGGNITTGTLSLETGAAGGADLGAAAAHAVARVQTAGAGVGNGGLRLFQARAAGITIGPVNSRGNVSVSDNGNNAPVVLDGLLDASLDGGANVTLSAGAGTGSVAVNGQIRAGNGQVALLGRGGVSQANTGAGISADSLRGQGSGVNLSPTGTGAADVNSVGTFAGTADGSSLSFRNQGSFNVGLVNATRGIDAAGPVSLRTNAAGATVTQAAGSNGAITTPTLNLTTNNGNVTLTGPANRVPALGTVDLGNGAFAFWALLATPFNVGAVTANGGIDIASLNSDLTTSAAVAASSNIALRSSTGALTLGGAVTSTNGSVTLRSRTALDTGLFPVSAPAAVTGDVSLISDTSTVAIGAGGVTVGDTLGIQIGPGLTLTVGGAISVPSLALVADQMAIGAAVNVTGAISLAPVTTGTAITLGNHASPTGLVIDNTELGFLASAPTLNIGRNLGGAAVAGELHVGTASVGSATLNLFTGSGVSGNSGALTVGGGSGALNVTAGGTVALNSFSNAIGSIGGSTASGDFQVVGGGSGGTGALTARAVSAAGDVILRNFAGDLTVTGPISSGGSHIFIGSNNGSGSRLMLQDDVDAGTGLIVLFSSGGMTQTAGVLTGAGLSASNFHSGSIALTGTNQVAGNVGLSNVQGDIRFDNASGFTVGGLPASLFWPGIGSFAPARGVITPATAAVTLGVGGNVVQSADVLTTGTLNLIRLGAANPDVTLDNAGNSVTTLGTVSLGNGALQLRAGNGDLAVAGPVSAGSVQLQADGSITGSAGASITTPGGAITLNADRDASGQGAIALTGTTIASNGGDIILGGGTNPTTTAAVGAAGSAGIALAGSTLNSGAGNITLIGTGGGTGHGVQLDGATSVSSGSGNIVIAATAGGGTGAHDFATTAGATAVTSTSGRWLIYTSAPANNTYGGLLSGQAALYERTFAGDPPAGIAATGNRYVFASNPGSLTVTGNFNDSKTYGDAYAVPAAVAGTHYSLSGFVNAATFGGVFVQDSAANIGLSGAPTFTSSGDAAAANVAGSPYAFTWSNGTIANTAGYTFAAPVNGGALTVDPRPISVGSSAGQGKTYGADDLIAAGTAYTVTAGSLALGQTLTGAMGRAAGETVGSYNFTRGAVAVNDGSGGANYNVTFDGASDPFTITAAPLTASIAGPAKTYGADDPAPGSLAVTLGGMVQRSVRDLNGNTTAIDDSAAVAVSLATLTRTPGEDVGSRSITGAAFNALTGAAAGNYTAPAALAGTPALAIAPASLTASFASTEKTYGDADPDVAGSAAAVGGLINRTVSTWNGNVAVNDSGLSASVAGASRIAGENVGTYAYVGGAFSVGSSNYTSAAFAGSPVLTIQPRPITLAAEPATKVYGDADPALAVRIGAGSLGAVTVADTLFDVTGILSRMPGADVGSYDIRLGAGARAGNYIIAFDAGNRAFTITPRPVAVTALGGTSTYGEGPANPGLAAGNLAAGDSVASLTGLANGFGITAATAAGNHTLDVQGTLGNPNYVLASTTSGQWLVLPKAASVTAHDQARTEGAAFRFTGTEFTATGLVPGETIATVSLASAGVLPGATAGAYAITPSSPVGTNGFAASNYAIRYVDGQMMVLRSPGLAAIIASTLQDEDRFPSVPPPNLVNLQVVGSGIKLPAEAGGGAP